MIDGLFKGRVDRLWAYPARVLVRLGLTANQVTVIGLVLVTISCGAFVWHQSTVLFALCLGVSFATDALDGAVARLRGECTLFGGYFDAVVDRYQELIVLITIASMTDTWLPAMLVLTGAYLTSYAKARTAIETPIDNVAWPDLIERLERILFLCILLVVDGIAGQFLALSPYPAIAIGLWILAVLSHGTAIQRFFRARRILVARQQEAAARTRGLEGGTADAP